MGIIDILILLVIGLLAGAIARFLVPGRDPMGLIGTMVLGVIGAFVGGTLWNLIVNGEFGLEPSGFIGAVIGGIIALLIYRAVSSRA